MQLSLVNNYNKRYKWSSPVFEGYGRTYDFDYQGDQVTDPRPKALSLGRWRSGRGNDLMAGINLNYLSPEQIGRLQQNLQTILRNRNLRARARTLRRLMPDIFNTAYRTYNKDAVDNVDAGTLKFMSVAKDVDEPTQDPQNLDVPRPETAPNSSIDADDVEAPQIEPDVSRVRPEPKAEPKPTKVEPEQPQQPVTPDEPQDIGSDEVEPEEIDDDEEVQG